MYIYHRTVNAVHTYVNVHKVKLICIKAKVNFSLRIYDITALPACQWVLRRKREIGTFVTKMKQ